MAIRIAKRDDNPLKDVHPMSRNLAFWHTPKRLSEAAQCLAGSLANLLCNQSMSINQYLSIYLIIYIYIYYIIYIRIYIYVYILNLSQFDGHPLSMVDVVFGTYRRKSVESWP